MSPKTILIFLLTSFLLKPVLAQEKPGLQKLMPRKFIDKYELFAGPTITIPVGTDKAAGNNPNVTTGYFSKAGYCIGFGLIHSIGKFELRSRILWDQRGYTEKLWDNEPSSYSEFINEKKIDYLTISFLPSIAIGSKKRIRLLSGFSYSQLQKLRSIQSTYYNGQLMQVFKTTVTWGTSNNSFDYLFGIECALKSIHSKEINVLLLGNHGLIPIVKENGQEISINIISLIVSMKFDRKPNLKSP